MNDAPLKLLFVKESQNWPRSSGHDVHGFHMMKALADRGHAVSLATVAPPTDMALAGLPLESRYVLDPQKSQGSPLRFTALQRRFTSYFGVPDGLSHSLAKILEQGGFDAVVVVARHLLPLLRVVRNSVRVWYPADDPAWHHLSRLKLLKRETWGELKLAALNGLFERSFRASFDRIWVVSPTDRTAARLITGCREVDLIPNGVDAEYYRPGRCAELPRSAVFWGRLDFGPNVEALEWFLAQAWPSVRAAVPDARLDVFGFNPTDRVRKLAGTAGVSLFPDLPDLRDEVRRRQVVVLPFVSGGGIKNKLLEAAAMGMPIVASRWAMSGLKGQPAVTVAGDWAKSLRELWMDDTNRARLGRAARDWVTRHHTWNAAAATAEAGIRRMRTRSG